MWVLLCVDVMYYNYGVNAKACAENMKLARILNLIMIQDQCYDFLKKVVLRKCFKIIVN